MHIEIEIDIFSGRPNPSWMLGPAEAEELMTHLRQHRLPPSDDPQPQLGLGFRGFVLHQTDAYGRMHPWLWVGGGTISVLTGSARRNFCDIVGLEDWLVELAKRAGYGALLNDVGKR